MDEVVADYKWIKGMSFHGDEKERIDHCLNDCPFKELCINCYELSDSEIKSYEKLLSYKPNPDKFKGIVKDIWSLYCDGYTEAEIAKILNVHPQTVNRKRTSAGIPAFPKALDKQGRREIAAVWK